MILASTLGLLLFMVSLKLLGSMSGLLGIRYLALWLFEFSAPTSSKEILNLTLLLVGMPLLTSLIGIMFPYSSVPI